MASSPSEQWSKGLRKITAVNRFAQSEAAGIKPGEDASDLIDRTSYRRQDTASTPVGNHHASRLYQDGLSERLKGLRNGLLSGQESKSSDSTCSEQSSGNSSSVRSVSHARRAADHRVFPYSKHDPTRPSNHRRLSSLSAVSETEPPFYSQFWAESPSIPPLSDFGGSMSAADSNAPSLTSRTTASTCDSLSEPVGVSRVLERQHPHSGGCWPPHDPYSNAHTSIGDLTASPPSTPGFRVRDPLNPFNPAMFDCATTTPQSVNSTVSPDMSRQPSAEGTIVDTPKPGHSSSKNHNEHNKSRDRSESEASKPSNNDPSTPRKSSDDAPSDHEDSGSSSDSCIDAIQQEVLEQVLSPIKTEIVEKIVCHILHLPDLVGAKSLNDHEALKLASPVSPMGLERLQLSPRVNLVTLGESETEGTIKHSFTQNAGVQDANNDCGQSHQRAKTTGRLHGKSNATATGHTTPAAFIPSHKRKGAPGGDSEDDDDDDSDDEDRRPPAPKVPRPVSNRRIACPYFQRDPTKEPKADSCFRNGFKNIHKMKEHLQRVHSNIIQCPRCFAVFNREEQLTQHIRAMGSDLCQPSEQRPVIDAYNQTQARALQDRMRGKTDLQKWKLIWRILFPSDSDEDIPEPWWTSRNPLGRPEVSAFLARYEAFTHAHIAAYVRPRVQDLVFPLFDELVGANMDAILRDSLEHVFEAFRAGEGRGLLVDGAGAAPANASLPEPGPSRQRNPQLLRQLDTAAADVDMGAAEEEQDEDEDDDDDEPVTAVQQAPRNGLPAAAAFTVNGVEQQQQQQQQVQMQMQMQQPQLLCPMPDANMLVGAGHAGNAQLLNANGFVGSPLQRSPVRTPESWDFALDALNESTYPGGQQGFGEGWRG